MAVRSANPSLLERIMPAPRHAWTIDVDHRATGISRGMINNLAGVMGPHGMCGLPIDMPDTYRLLDGDGFVLYEGKTNAGTLAARKDTPHTGFEPLEDFGRGKGAAYIEYNIGGKWHRPKGTKAR